ncbi:SpoIID/LytB domain protein [Cyanobacterium stanieri PCC 7202]|uniref:SpoIID/LytB domain protein n=1 Tax=Cyanobacterium stanieri (strain ATCC 29140 / PCC 7202) TaxID=292563 RepID=K9YIZ3_CYASC|nr:SpoIID/LytB domain protein [Cyanobacterium stanieri PCC 7202]
MIKNNLLNFLWLGNNMLSKNWQLFFSCLFFLGLTMPNSVAKAVELQVGIVQRFGEELEDKLIITSTEGDNLTLRFREQDGEGNNPVRALTTNQVNLTITPQSLEQPKIRERVILGDHGTFETAEDSANRWRELGIEVEITQPGRWQVWAKRDVYNTPLLKRLLLNSIQKADIDDVYIETEVLLEIPEVSFTVGNNTYRVDYLDINTNKNLVRVREGDNGTTRLYGGRLNIQPNAYGDYTLVNRVDIETYLRGVVPHEIGANAPRAAAEAQTIIARTYALRNTRRFEADNYQMCATTHCQVYYGLGQTSNLSDQAIASTRGLVLTYDNELVDALYFSTSGGVTSAFSDTWNGEDRPYLQPVIDAPTPIWDLAQNPLNYEANLRRFISLDSGFNEVGRRLFRWNRPRSLQDLNSDLKKYLERIRHPLAEFNTIKKMEVTERSISGRILVMEVETDLGMVKLEKNEVRSAFEPPVSTLFYLDPIYKNGNQLDGYRFVGGGFGHGVGLSQFGSYSLANRGYSAQQILEFYYPQARIQPLNGSIVWWQGD